jgi:hypothetical protein
MTTSFESDSLSLINRAKGVIVSNDGMFCTLTSASMAKSIESAMKFVCFVGPGVQLPVAQAIVEVCARLGPEKINVCLDLNGQVMRMGYGAIEAVLLLVEAGIAVQSAPGIRTGLLVIDDRGFVFTPTPLYLEGEPDLSSSAPNALRISQEQMTEALVRLSPTAKVIALAQAKTLEEKSRVSNLPIDVKSETINEHHLVEVKADLKQAPPVRFDLARQVRVFEPYLQYVELHLTGAAIQKHKLAIPPSIQKLGGSKDIENRLRTTFDLIEKGSKLSSKPLEDALNEIRKSFTPSLGKDHGRVVLKAAKPRLTKRLDDFRLELQKHKKSVEKDLQDHLNSSRKQIVEYYVPRVIESPPDCLYGQLLSETPSEDDAARWLNAELDRIFPKAASLVKEMKLDERYKDVTFETLNKKDFLESVKAAFPRVDWDKTYTEFKAAGEQKDRKAP